MGISLGLIGLGSFGSCFAPLFKSHPLIDRIAFCDLNPQSLAKFANNPFYADKFNPCDAYSSLEGILKAKLDAVVIMTHPELHAPQAIAAMEAGKHVYSAVPVISLPDYHEVLEWCDRIIRTSEKTGMRYMLGETTIYRAKTMFCKRMAAEGKFGSFVYAEGEYMHDVDGSCNLRDVMASRNANPGSAPGPDVKPLSWYRERGIKTSPMAFPRTRSAGRCM